MSKRGNKMNKEGEWVANGECRGRKRRGKERRKMKRWFKKEMKEGEEIRGGMRLK